jgi:hypothetical protein
MSGYIAHAIGGNGKFNRNFKTLLTVRLPIDRIYVSFVQQSRHKRRIAGFGAC